MPAHCISSSVHWKGSRMGLPSFRRAGGGSGSVLRGSVGCGLAALVPATSMRANAAAANRMLRTILAQVAQSACRSVCVSADARDMLAVADLEHFVTSMAGK